MQTFLPYKSFHESAACLDNKRLCKQRLEVLQLIRAIQYGTGWAHHPAAAMWRNHLNALVNYGTVICQVWMARGYKDTLLDRIRYHHEQYGDIVDPPWLGNAAFHRSHQSNLVRKLPEHYRKFFPDVPDDLPYVWPAT